MPLQPDAQRIPVLGNWLKNPNPKNSAEWLKWQAKYFNHLDRVAYGLRFAFLNGGKDVYPTDAGLTFFDQPTHMIYNLAKEAREKQIIAKLKDKIGIMLFLGKNLTYEYNNRIYLDLWRLSQPNNFWRNKVNFMIVLPSKKIKERIEHILYTDKAVSTNNVRAAWLYLEKNHKIIINPNLFKKFNIYMTPSVVLTYKKKDNNNKEKIYYSTIAVGATEFTDIRTKILAFLKYEGLINPKDLSMQDNLRSFQKNLTPSKIDFKNKMRYNEKDGVKSITIKGEENE
jgi:hypothetical protein